MKYIRTKNGILRVMVTKTTEPMYIEGRGELIGYWGYKQNGDYVNGEILTKDIVKQADTIDELCDDFFLVANKLHGFGSTINERGWVNGYSSFEHCKEDYDDTKYYADVQDLTLYGAVLTDKGLIYVAKMSEKGELELL